MKCDRCCKNTDELQRAGCVITLTQGFYCKDCAEIIENKDKELLKAIKNNENIYKYIK